MTTAAQKEGVTPEFLREGLAKGTITIPANVGHRNLDPIAIGTGVRVKINANIGTSPHDINLEKEKAKLAASIRYGAHTVMDLSTGGDLNAIRTELLAQCPMPFGTVPIYQVMAEAQKLEEVSAADIIAGRPAPRPARGGFCHRPLRRHPPGPKVVKEAGHRRRLPGRGLSGGLDAPFSARKSLVRTF